MEIKINQKPILIIMKIKDGDLAMKALTGQRLVVNVDHY